MVIGFSWVSEFICFAFLQKGLISSYSNQVLYAENGVLWIAELIYRVFLLLPLTVKTRQVTSIE